jgi:hypothetical protein
VTFPANGNRAVACAQRMKLGYTDTFTQHTIEMLNRAHLYTERNNSRDFDASRPYRYTLWWH